MNTQNQHPHHFYDLGIAPRILEALERLHLTIPTPIQYKCIPPALEGKDIVGIAQTGTGKTLAFGIPMIQRLAQLKGQGLILLPTRELAIQVDEELQKIGRSFGLKTAVLIGGAAMGMQMQRLRHNPHIIVATPGRLLDHMEHKTVNLAFVRILVLDEADRMFDMGFAPQINRILAAVSKDRQTMLFSATMPSAIMNLASRHMKLPIRFEIAPPGTAAERVTHELFVVKKEAKARLLESMLGQYHGSVLTFVRRKHDAKRIVRVVRAMGHGAAELHSGRSLPQRREALEGFKSGKYRVLVATDIAARGIDVKGIELVLNFDLPDNPEDYVHRIGRTGRAGHEGHAVSFAMPDQASDVRAIERLIRLALPVSRLPELPPERFIPPPERNFGGYGRRPQRPGNRPGPRRGDFRHRRR
ncbi:hypothetical protein A3B21_00915 [Candidatus Uhrbacteria bacterium RIFCSPLOWO2_01_FULL_47_24]|uniref:DEAD/DEAH box helicase n=1 Tax=Candidatus Uhrbacteria bacterium RIFCSPLOWO2_01_FULL_47_24 TaxID=1802401 RepID=A0A1F7UQD7_9BACT|nr:MAG: hypothetical protein A3D58_01080 [Candidatus Uhrbacteria bacterium RIFCSPHIGHO2_02_FULL_46_47]OGL76630.1 MAG: hypothetical protein A3F52_03600 [Candidatus Uhrbacteria bacterium RIFCSPHIGHO2_12_FULL_47_11]OGL79954.1 MAG: hypothetical protein A3B21_00915 [Candidatus Uhrbacteria bacterium RIFCSPLOWO2_01_FULL_47_24]OGL84334.1 MAG: hypothetical protein A3J03_00385 [Candidatus Uhrbacteria bacterium RIFCSPLOWO2_02_FULL_46_25]OGL91992.1 MAG: hypothetical protein A3H11_01530 [Candidatus Uhrbacte